MHNYYFPEGFSEDPTKEELKDNNKRRKLWTALLNQLCSIMGMPDMNWKCLEKYAELKVQFDDQQAAHKTEIAELRALLMNQNKN
jgi:hypothetical protein